MGLCDGMWILYVIMYDNFYFNRKYKYICDVCVEKCFKKNGVIMINLKKNEKLKSLMIILSLLIDIFVNWLFILVGYFSKIFV